MLRFLRLLLPALALTVPILPAHAGPGDAGKDSVYLIGEFVDPVCVFQHGMQGVLQKRCALVRGRVEQGMYFLDIRERRLYSVIGQNHWEDPRNDFLEALGDTFAVTGRVWNYAGSKAIAIDRVWRWRQQPEPAWAWWPWSWEWSVLAGCGLLVLLYARALARRGVRCVEGWRIACFAGAIATVVISLNGPIHDLSDRYLFSTHMVQHLLLAQIFPPLLILGVPAWAWKGLLSKPPLAAVWNLVTAAPVGFLLYTVVFSIWHVPSLYDLMMRQHSFHIAMHLMVMGTALWMWWPIVAGEAVTRPLPPPAQMLYLFLLGTPMMAVAAMITYAREPLYAWYALAPRFLGVSALDDQRLGGLLMWVPGGLFYWGIMTIVFFRWARPESRSEDPYVRGTA